MDENTRAAHEQKLRNYGYDGGNDVVEQPAENLGLDELLNGANVKSFPVSALQAIVVSAIPARVEALQAQNKALEYVHELILRVIRDPRQEEASDVEVRAQDYLETGRLPTSHHDGMIRR